MIYLFLNQNNQIMKKKIFVILFAAVLAAGFTACTPDETNTTAKTKTITFENVTLNNLGLNNNDSVSGSIVSGDAAVTVTWEKSYGYNICSGFVVSNQTDTTNAGYTNPYSCVAQSGADGSSNYAVFNSSSDSVKFNSPVDLKSVMLCNNAYAYVSMQHGDAYAKKFESGDFFKVILTMYGEKNDSIGSQDFYLANFLNGNSTIVNTWTKLDLSTFANVSYIKFSFESSDTGDYGINTPTYFCLDNIEYTND